VPLVGIVTDSYRNKRRILSFVNPNPNPNPNIETRQYDVDAQQLVRDASQAEKERAIVVKKATRTEASLTRALSVEKDRVDELKAECEQKRNELNFVERNGAKERRQLEIDKASLADQITVSRNNEARLNTRANELRAQRVSLKQFRLQGQINIDKAVVQQISAVKSDTKVVCALEHLSFATLFDSLISLPV
jgi:hypothetical protein